MLWYALRYNLASPRRYVLLPLAKFIFCSLYYTMGKGDVYYNVTFKSCWLLSLLRFVGRLTISAILTLLNVVVWGGGSTFMTYG